MQHLPMPMPMRTVCARDCYDSCGLLAVPDADGRLMIRGDKSHPVNQGGICAKCSIAYNGSYQNDALRLTMPLRRAGKKGQGKFKPISWDEALDEISSRLRNVLREEGPQAILNAHYTGTRGVLARDFPMRFFHAIGATEVSPDTICNIAGQLAAEYLYGSGLQGFDPREIADAACVVVWGCNPSVTGPHTHRHWLKSTDAPLVVVDPVKTDTARKADLHLQLRPGSDAMLAFAVLKVLKLQGGLATGFIAQHVMGWEDIDRQLDALSLDEAQQATGIGIAQIEQFARLYGAGPSLLWIGMGMTRQRWGGNAVRSILLLPAATGSIARAGAGFSFINGAGAHGVDLADVMGTHLRRNQAPSVSHMDLVERLRDSAASRALFCWNINIAATNPRQAALRRELARESLFTVVADLFMTDTADLADIVLPAASFLEHDDLVYSYFHMTLSAQVAVRSPPGLALPNQEIFRRLSRRMGFCDEALFEKDETILERITRGAQPGMGFEALKRTGTVMVSDKPLRQFAGAAFPTPSGMIEVRSSKAQKDGLPAVPSPRYDATLLEGEFRLLTPAGKWLSNSIFGNDPAIRRRYQETHVRLHPRDATRVQLPQGSMAMITSTEGTLTAQVVHDSGVLPQTAVMPKNGWAKLARGGGSSNQLTNACKSDMGEGSSVQSLVVRIAPAAPSSRTPQPSP
jgi:anaerobic selenocysteine-containing dehydrogenase